MRFIVAFLIAALATPTAGHAQATTPAPTTDATASLPAPTLLHANERAPFEGELILQADLMRWAMQIETLRHQLELDGRTATERCDVRLSLEQARTTAASAETTLHDSLYAARIQELAAALTEARTNAVRQPWESPALWFAIGAVVAAAAGVGLAIAAH